jgi:hypothetical protein
MDYMDYIGKRRPGREDHFRSDLGVCPPFFRQRAACASLCRPGNSSRACSLCLKRGHLWLSVVPVTRKN